MTPEEHSYEVSCDPDHPIFMGDEDFWHDPVGRIYAIGCILYLILLIAALFI